MNWTDSDFNSHYSFVSLEGFASNTFGLTYQTLMSPGWSLHMDIFFKNHPDDFKAHQGWVLPLATATPSSAAWIAWVDCDVYD